MWLCGDGCRAIVSDYNVELILITYKSQQKQISKVDLWAWTPFFLFTLSNSLSLDRLFRCDPQTNANLDQRFHSLGQISGFDIFETSEKAIDKVGVVAWAKFYLLLSFEIPKAQSIVSNGQMFRWLLWLFLICRKL